MLLQCEVVKSLVLLQIGAATFKPWCKYYKVRRN